MVDGALRSDGNRSVAGERETEFAVWSNGNLSLVATTVDGRTNYGRRRGGGGFLVDGVGSATNHDRLYVLFTVMNVTRVERIKSAKLGTPTYRVVANDLSNPVALTSNDGFDSVENVSLVAVVDTWGLVHRYRFEVTDVRNGKRIRRTETFEVTNVGETQVTRPPWFEEAMKNTSKR